MGASHIHAHLNHALDLCGSPAACLDRATDSPDKPELRPNVYVPGSIEGLWRGEDRSLRLDLNSAGFSGPCAPRLWSGCRQAPLDIARWRSPPSPPAIPRGARATSL